LVNLQVDRIFLIPNNLHLWRAIGGTSVI